MKAGENARLQVHAFRSTATSLTAETPHNVLNYLTVTTMGAEAPLCAPCLFNATTK
jgi:hypothetical protein